MNKHTKGPWAVSETVIKCSGKLEIFGDGTHVASVTVGKKGITPEQEANANLIGASPKLLDALVGLYQMMLGRDSDSWKTPAMQAAERAIFEAKEGLKYETE